MIGIPILETQHGLENQESDTVFSKYPWSVLNQIKL